MPSFYNVDNAGASEALSRIEPLEADVIGFGHGDPWRGGPAAAVAAARS